MPLSFCERVVASCEQHADRAAMRVVGDETQVYTFGQMLSMIRSVTNKLAENGIERGDRVALIGENHPIWAIAYLGTLFRGAVCVPLDPQGEIATITNFVENSGAKLAFLSSEQIERFEKVRSKLNRNLPAAVWGPAEKDTDAPTTSPFSDWISSRPAAPDTLPTDTDIAVLIYTSGTTGTPKGVPLTHGNIMAELEGIKDVLKISADEKILSLLPLFHAYLQIVNLWVATTYGCEVGYLKELSPAALGDAMKEFRPTILTTVPRLWYLFHKKIFDAVGAKPAAVRMVFRTLLAANALVRDTINANLGRRFFKEVHRSFGGELRLAVSAGSRFDEEVALDFYKLGFTILQGYGLTETSGAATATHEDDNRVGSVGKPMKGTEIRIDEPDKEGIGEVLIKGKIVFDGYYRNLEATDGAFTSDGWFRSGDLGRLDREGHLYIVGRKKDVIVLPSGKNVYPEDIEEHYLKSPLVEELAVLGVKDDSESRVGAERLLAVVVPDFAYLKSSGVANSKEAIRHDLDNLGRELPEYQRVRDYRIRAEPLPRTATRKIKRFELRQQIESGKTFSAESASRSWTLSTTDKEILASPIGLTVANAIRPNLKTDAPLHPEMNLEIDLGLDSLARAETFAALENATASEFGVEEAAAALTVKEVIDLVRRHSTNGNQPTTVDSNWSKIVGEADEITPEIEPVLRNQPIFSVFAFSVYRTFNLFCRVFMRLEVENIECLRSMKRPFIICPNHQSFLDPFVLCSNYSLEFFKNTFHVGASEFFRNRFMRRLSRLLNVVPIDPDTQLMKAMKAGATGLRHGKILNIYPEGERAFDGKLHEFKKGAAILSESLQLPILPVAMDGLYKVWPRRSWRIRPAKVRIKFGEPIFPDEVPPGNRQYDDLIARVKDEIASMIEEMRSR